MLESVLNQSGVILGVLGFLFGFYQLRRADQAQRKSEKAQRELADLQADRTEAAQRRADRLELYRAHLAKLDRVAKLAADGAQSGELAESQARMWKAIQEGGDFMDVVADSMQAAVNFMRDWGAEAGRIANETQELRLVASPALLPLLDDYADATKSFADAGSDYVTNQAQEAALAIAQGRDPVTEESTAMTALYERLQTIRAEIETQMRKDLGSDL